MLRFHTLVSNHHPLSSIITSSSSSSSVLLLFSSLRFSSSAAADEVPSAPEALIAFQTLGYRCSSLNDLCRQGETEQSVKKKFLELAKQQHPDVLKTAGTSSEKSKKTMSEINGAYKIVKSFFKAGGFSKFGASSSSFSNNAHHNYGSNASSNGAYYKNPHSQYSSSGGAPDDGSEYFWSGFEDVSDSYPYFTQAGQAYHPNSFRGGGGGGGRNPKNNGGSKKGNNSNYEFYASSNPYEGYFTEDELRQAAQAARNDGAEFFHTEHDFTGPNGEELNPEEAFAMWQSFNEMYASGFPSENISYDDARTMHQASDFYAAAAAGGGPGGFHFPFEFAEFDEAAFHSQQQRYQNRGGRNNQNKQHQRGNNSKNMNRRQHQEKKSQKKKPWMNPDEFFDEGFESPNKTHHNHQNRNHQNRGSNSNNNNKNKAGINLSPEEYEAILNMHADGRSFSFIGNSLGLTEHQAIAGFNVAKKKAKEEEWEKQKAEKEKASRVKTEVNNNTTSKNASNKAANNANEHVKKTSGPSSASTPKTNKEKKLVYDVDDDNDSSTHVSGKEYFSMDSDEDEEGIFEDDDDVMYEDGEFPKPFNGKPIHHHSMGKKFRNHQRKNNNSSSEGHFKNKQKWRNGGGNTRHPQHQHRGNNNNRNRHNNSNNNNKKRKW